MKNLTTRQKKLFKWVSKQHRGQLRKGGEKYINHLIRVADMARNIPSVAFGLEIGLLHDVIEDQLKQYDTDKMKSNHLFGKLLKFGYDEREAIFIVNGVLDLTDQYTKVNHPDLNRKQRKERENMRLSGVVMNSMTIKYCDLIDNTGSIIEYDPNFGAVYLKEKFKLLKLMNIGDQRTLVKCWETLADGLVKLNILRI